MTGIVSYGAYIPRYRINRKLIYQAMGWFNPASFMPGEKAVANYDEDSVTMSVAAAMDCLGDRNPQELAGVFFASTTAPYLERQSAQIIATAVDAPSELRSVDFTDTTKSATTAMLSALDAVAAGTGGDILVCGADKRNAKAGSSQEVIFGDAAAAVVIGAENPAAKFMGSFSVSYDFMDHWRGAGEAWDHQWEDRFIRDEGYAKFIIEAVKGLLAKTGLTIDQVGKMVYPCLYAADFKKIAKILGLSPEQMVEPLLGTVGYAGAADPMLHLVKALEESEPGQRVLMVSYGSGAEAVLFEATDRLAELKTNRRGVAGNLSVKRELTSYEKMAAWRGLLPLEKGIRGEITAFTAVSDLWRNRRQILGLCGSRCLACGLPQYPVQRVCANPECGAIDQIETYRFSDKRGTLFTYTGDNLAYSPNPPAIYGIVEFDGGGRFWFDITDADLDKVAVGMPVEMSFRRKYVDDKFGIHGYFWKAAPAIS